MTRFLAIWAGQLVSLLGTALTAFGLTIFIYRQTKSVEDLALVAIAAYLPQLLVAPYGGVLADRFDRGLVMLAADTGAALSTAALFWLVINNRLDPLVAAALVALGSACNAIQWPAWEAAIVTLVPATHLPRANGLVELSRGLGQLIAPVLGGLLVDVIGLAGLVAIDLASFLVGIVPLLFLRFPPRTPAPPAHWLADLRAAWRFVVERTGLVVMLAVFAATALTFGVAELLFRPLVLRFAEPWALGVVLSMVGVGIIAGALGMAAWGGPSRKVQAIMVLQVIEGAALVLAGLFPSLPSLCAAAFIYGAVIPPTFACARTIWQVKVPTAMQGRVSALRSTIVMLAVPVGYVVAPPLASRLGTAETIGWMGVVTALAGIIAYAFRSYREVETQLADAIPR